MALWHTMMMTFTAKDMATSVIARLEKSLGKLGPAAVTAAKGVAGAFVAFQGAQAGVGLLKDAFGLAEDAGAFQKQLGLLNATAGATTVEMKAFHDKAMEIGLSTMHAPLAAAEGMTELVSAGMNARDAIKTIDDALLMATASAGKLSAGEIGEFLGNFANLFPGETDSNRIVNTMAQLANISSVTFEKVPAMYAKVARGSGPMQQSLAATSAALALFKNTTTSSEEAATSLGMAMQMLAAKPKNRALFEAATGVEVFDKAKNKFRDFTDILANTVVSPKWKSLRADEQAGVLSKVFESRQVGKVIGSMNQIMEKGFEDPLTRVVYKGEEGLRRMVQSFEDATKNQVAARFVTEQTSIFDGALKGLRAKWKSITTTMGEAIGAAFGPALAVVDTVLQAVGQLFIKIPTELRNSIATFFLVSVAAVTAAFGVGALVFAFIALQAVFAMFGGVLMAFLIKPMLIALAVMGVMALVGVAFYAAWKNNIGGFADFTAGAFEKVKLAFLVFKQLFAEGGTWGDVDKQIMDPKNSGLLIFIKEVWMWLGRLKQFATGVWEGFVESLASGGAIDTLVVVFNQLLNALTLTDSTAGENLSTWQRMAEIGRVVGKVMGTVASIIIYGIGAALKTATMLLDLFSGAWWLLGPLVKSVLNMVWGIVEIFVGLVTGDFDALANGILTVFKSVGSMILNLFGTIFKFIGAGVDAVAGVFGYSPNLGVGVDQYLRKQDEDLMSQGQKFGAGQATPQSPSGALGAIRGQATTTPAAAPVVNVSSTPVILNMDGKAIASGVIKYKHGVDNRSLMSIGPLPAHEGL
jgi:TP901 family phage tail tape measure protein